MERTHSIQANGIKSILTELLWISIGICIVPLVSNVSLDIFLVGPVIWVLKVSVHIALGLLPANLFVRPILQDGCLMTRKSEVLAGEFDQRSDKNSELSALMLSPCSYWS